MYSTCLYCTKDLGANQVLETLPVGRRLAFDATAGRLWVVCPACGKWNLVPFDTRLETIDACERIFHDTRTRFSTDNIGLARIREGLELVRIGPALRPEFAAWRYGDRFARRRRRNILVGTAAGIAILGVYAGAAALAGSSVVINIAYQSVFAAYNKSHIATRFVRESGGEPLTLTRHDVKRSRLVRVEGPPAMWGISVPERTGVRGRWVGGNDVAPALLTGLDAVAALAHLLPVISGTAGSKSQVSSAVALVERSPTMDSLIPRWGGGESYRRGTTEAATLGKLSVKTKLALEMLANEDSERRWLEGELKLLERQWREADRLAAIADRLALPEPGEE
jgi:hypothetical protein